MPVSATRERARAKEHPRYAKKISRREVSEVSDELALNESDAITGIAADRASFMARASHHGPGHERPFHYHGDAEGALNARSRFVGAHRHMPAREIGTATLTPLSDDLLIFQKIAAEMEREEAEIAVGRADTVSDAVSDAVSMDEVVVEAARRRRRVRAPHRAFRLNGWQIVIAGTLLGKLLLVLWLQSQSLALRNQYQKMGRDIAQTNELIAQTKKEISQLDSKAHLSQLAAQMKWDKAPLTSFDKIDDTRRLSPEEVAALTRNGNNPIPGPSP